VLAYCVEGRDFSKGTSNVFVMKPRMKAAKSRLLGGCLESTPGKVVAFLAAQSTPSLPGMPQ